VFYVVLTENSKFVDILKNLKIFLIGTILVNTLVVYILSNGRLVSIGSTLRLHRKKIRDCPLEPQPGGVTRTIPKRMTIGGAD